MSGGSFNYAYLKIEELYFPDWQDVLGAAQAIEDEGYPQIARDIREMHKRLQSFKEEFEASAYDLSEVIKAIEWERSGDWGNESFVKCAEWYLDKKKERHD